MDSPRARPPGEFQWEATLWHELAHVVTLQMSKQRVPRWLTEGISVYEETLARPEWGRGQDVEFAQMLNEGTVAQAAGPELRLHRPAHDFDGLLPGLAARRAHRRRPTATRGCTSCCAPTAKGVDTEAALKTAIEHRLRPAPDRLRRVHRQALRRDAHARWWLPRRASICSRCRCPASKDYVEKNPDSFPAQMTLGTALRRSGRCSTRRFRCSRSAASPRAVRDRTRQARRRRSRRSRCEKKDSRARHRRAARGGPRTTSTTSTRRASWRSCSPRPG